MGSKNKDEQAATEDEQGVQLTIFNVRELVTAVTTKVGTIVIPKRGVQNSLDDYEPPENPRELYR
ncbi:MAG: hypothetical protein QY318_00345 [Candidatus Dojkabacteria bacterium]|nr:MAG: hypothetical protein QY318_00345 [Candidatus Dojkabacteria bacterium]